jgi:UDP-GlcNAc3NAcA epimerase
MQIELQKFFNAVTIHTGQHYDSNMSEVFFEQLGMARPDYLLDLGGSKPQGEQTGMMMTEIEKITMQLKPDAILIYGDTNSTLAAALVAAKMQIPQIHIEAGLRSYNRTMPEEVNRIVADQFGAMLFCPTSTAVMNLKKEGINHAGIFECGDVMCDALKLVEHHIRPLSDDPYYFVTLHRPYNVDNPDRLSKILTALNQLDQTVIFPVHPRTVSRMKEFGLIPEQFGNIRLIEPVGYVESLSYQKFAGCIITDSGGMQKEAYMLRKKCITVRSETEWTETLMNGWNTLEFDNPGRLKDLVKETPGAYIENLYGTGNASKTIVEQIRKKLD